MTNYGYVYKTTFLKTGLIYVGQHATSEWDGGYIGSGKIITELIKEHGKYDAHGHSNFSCELIEWASNQVMLDEREVYWIDALDARNPEVGYNLAVGGSGGWFKGMRHTEEEKALIGAASRNRVWLTDGHNNRHLQIDKDIDIIQALLDSGWHYGVTQVELTDEMQEYVSKTISTMKKGKFYFYNKHLDTCKFIGMEEIPKYLSEGYIYGNRAQHTNGSLGRWMNDSINNYFCTYEEIGYKLYYDKFVFGKLPVPKLPKPEKPKAPGPGMAGRKHTTETKQKIREKRLTQTNLNMTANLGKHYYTDGKNEGLYRLGSEPIGYYPGRLCYFLTAADGNALVCVANAEEQQYIPQTKLSEYLNTGYHIGTLPRHYRDLKLPKDVYCFELGSTFSCPVEVEKQLGIPSNHINAACNGRRATAGGYHWQFISERGD